MVENVDPAAYIPPPVAPSGGQAGTYGRRQQPQRDERRQAVVDVASVLGLPENIMPAAIQEAFLGLVDQVERLREELDRVKLHETFLATAAERHSLMPALTRRAFMNGLTRLLEASERADLPGSIAYLHVAGIEALREQQGLAAGDAVLVHIAETIQAELRQTDLLGYLDSSDFAVALAVATTDGALSKINRIVANLSLSLAQIRVGIVHFAAGMTADSLLALADQASRRSAVRQ